VTSTLEQILQQAIKVFDSVGVVAKEGEGHSDCGQIVKNVEKRNT
jgi:hypothetical protein